MGTFAVERFLAAATDADLALAVEREDRVARAMTASGMPAGLRSSIYLPTDETWFAIFEAPSAEALEEANQQAGLQYARILPAIPMQHLRPD